MINKILKLILGSTALLFVQSCEKFVDVVPDNIAVIEDAFATRQSTERFLASLYSRIPSVLSNGSSNPQSFPQNPSLASSGEIWLNEGRRVNDQNFPYETTDLLLGNQGILAPSVDIWGGGNNLFIGIRDCNIFLENIDLPYDLPEHERLVWSAEAKFLKAYFHFFLMRMYGPIPVMRENIEVASGLDAIRVEREPVDDVANYIVELLDEAIADLPVLIANSEEQLGRVTKATAAAIKARTLMTVASPLFNGNSDYSVFVNANGEELINTTFDQNKWVRAEEACEQAVELAHSGGHQLHRAIRDASWSDTTAVKMDVRGSVTEPWNDELIWGKSNESTFAIQSASRPKMDIRSRTSIGAWGFWAPTLMVAETYYSNHGVPINEDVTYDYDSRYDLQVVGTDHEHYVAAGIQAPLLHLYREPRFYASLGFDGGIWLEDQAGQALIEDDAYVIDNQKGGFSYNNGRDNWSETGYYAKKLSNPKNFLGEGNNLSVERYPFPLIRLADVYLLYAEALNETGKLNEAHVYIDLVRERAGLGGVIDSWANYSINSGKPLTQDGLREIIQQERMIELALEGQRFWDMRRWKRATEFMNKDIQGWNRLGDNIDLYYKVKTFATPKFLKRDYLWPISEYDIIRNPKLIQNPGW
ncbi:MAG: RagB/SusD family nutrient uptake outer membrane protein [Cyclobacteriaceae bacterium]